ncbi:hypothetical protein [Microbacterium sp. Bi121]|uniref:hypothetical protein n=1 Tax=Microbacterium sp. Bi121 TaxID=2822348 RepID=UPI001E57E88E|nr:hypothetical protein [Microbacterium sp. Bi121]
MSDDKQLSTRSVKSTRADAMRRATDAWSLRIAGHTWEQVAQKVGFNDGPAAHRAVKNFFGNVPTPAHDELRILARARGEVVFRQALTDVLEQRPGAVRAAVAVLQRQAALDGLDAPTKSTLAVENQHDMDEIFETLERAGVFGPRGPVDLYIDVGGDAQ